VEGELIYPYWVFGMYDMYKTMEFNGIATASGSMAFQKELTTHDDGIHAKNEKMCLNYGHLL